MLMRALSDVFTDFKATLTAPEVTIGNVLEALHERGFGFVLLLFALPMALPLPVPPGINILLATPLLILTAQQALGRHTIWMPERLKRKTFARDKLCGVIDSALPLLKRIEALTRPRLGFITDGIFSNLIGILGLIMALTVCIPVPLTNTVPSMGIALMALGVIMRDGLAVIAGALIGTLWVCMLAFAVLFFGAEGLDVVKEAIKSFL